MRARSCVCVCVCVCVFRHRPYRTHGHGVRSCVCVCVSPFLCVGVWVCCVSQVCDDQSPHTLRVSVLLSLLVSVASKPTFNALRTQQRLGYVVSLSAHRVHGVASLQVRT